MWPGAANPTMRYLFLLSSILIFTACSNPSLPEGFPTRSVSEKPAPPSVDQQPVTIVSPTPLPVVDFQGISMVYDEQVFGVLQDSIHQQAAAAAAESVPLEHIRLVFEGSDLFNSSEILVIPIDHYMAFSDKAVSHITLLENMLRDRPVQPHSPLPLFPLSSEAEAFLDIPTYLNFQGGNGVSFVSQIDRGSEKQLLFTFQGITDDDKFYVTALMPLKAKIKGTEAEEDDTLAQIASKLNYIDPELAEAMDALHESISSLKIQPRDEFPSPAPAAYMSYPGLLMAYDPEISGTAAVEKTAPAFISPDGSAVFLAGVPDAIQVTFYNKDHERQPILLIQPVRGATKQFFPTIPTEQQQQVQKLETLNAESDIPDEARNGKEFERLLHFQSGIGLRHINKSAARDDSNQSLLLTYQFQGITEDGRYLIQFDHPIQVAGSLEEVLLNADSDSSADFLQLLAKLDKMIESLAVASDVSSDSSIPVNPPDCTLDAQFVEDVTIPDHTIVERGNTLTKTWRVRNTGSCTWTPAYQIRLAGGNPVPWSQSSLLDTVPTGEVAEISVDIVSPEIPGNYHAWWQLVNDAGDPFGAFYYVLFEAPRPATDIPDHGVIEGELSYPASGMPAMTIYFLRTDGSQRFALETEQGWDHYANELPAGEYHVFARVTGDEGDSGGGYTAAVLCGMTCEDHSLVPVKIEEGKATRAINVLDWYAPAGTFPLP